MGEHQRPSTWHVLGNGIVLLEGWDEDSGSVEFLQLQEARPVRPEDLRAYDEASTRLGRSGSRWSLPLLLASRLLLLAVVAVPVGFVLARIDATEAAGGWLFWVGIPVGVLSYAVLKVWAWRLQRSLAAAQRDAGLAPGMVAPVDPGRARELIEAHGTRFTQAEAVAAVPGGRG